ncbi:MAG: MinD/ParA family protein [Planctomycetaceae bacterium]|nr:MinD/ParA family protein [Planctomycetaceae bacterium]
MQQRRTHTIAVASGKGGVGKSCVAANLAILISAAGHRVALVDADLALANLDIMLDVDAASDLSRVIEGAGHVSDIVMNLPCGLQFVPGASGLPRLADLSAFDRARLLEELSALEADNDVVVIDCGAGIGPEVLSFAAAADTAVIVTTPEPTAVTDAYALIKVLTRANASCAMTVVTNQARNAAEGRATCSRIANVAKQFLDVQVAQGGYVISDPKMSLAVRQRQPLVLAYPQCPASRCLADIARMLCSSRLDDVGREGFFKRVAGWLK